MPLLFQASLLRAIAAGIKDAKNRITGVIAKNKVQESVDCDRIQYFLHVLRVFEAEFLVQLKEWDQLSLIVGVRSKKTCRIIRHFPDC